MREKFISLLKQANRFNEEQNNTIINNLDKLGFFKSPASTQFHLSVEGGLCQHSLNVCEMALNLRQMLITMNPDLAQQLPIGSVIISALLHDICKAEIYKVEYRNAKNAQGVWEKVPYFKPDYSHLPLGHGTKSVIRLYAWSCPLTEDEAAAICWHMGAWDLSDSAEAKGNLSAAMDKYPLVNVLMSADSLASRLMEK